MAVSKWESQDSSYELLTSKSSYVNLGSFIIDENKSDIVIGWYTGVAKVDLQKRNEVLRSLKLS